MVYHYPKITSFIDDRRGSVFILVAAAAFMMIAATGAAVDMARAQILQAKMNSALDAAGLAAGATAVLTPVPATLTTQQWVEAQAQRYFNANFPTGYLGSGPVTVSATLSTDKTTVNLTASSTQQTTFMKAVGINTVPVSATSQITRANEGMELVLVLDNTGSMANAVNPSNSNTSKISALQSAINGTGGLLDILYGTGTTVPNMWIGVVPFTDTINIGTSHSNWMDTTYDSSLDFGPSVGSNSCPSYSGTTPATAGTHSGSPSRCLYSIPGSSPTNFGQSNWQGCVTARSASTKSTDTPSLNLDGSDDYPTTSGATGTMFRAFYYPTSSTTLQSGNKCSTSGGNGWMCYKTTGSGSNTSTATVYDATSSSLGPNVNCTPAQVLGMTATRSNISTEVSSMTANGNTMINLGMAWGYRMLSPNWQGKWGGEMDNTGNSQFPQLPLPYNTALMHKVIILMTDGMNTENDQAAYIGQTNQTPAMLDATTEAVCDTLKSNGVIIYTIGFGTTDDNNPNNPTSVDGPLLKYCATQYYTGDTSHYFLAPTNAVLASAFQNIGGQLANLRVSQ